MIMVGTRAWEGSSVSAGACRDDAVRGSFAGPRAAPARQLGDVVAQLPEFAASCSMPVQIPPLRSGCPERALLLLEMAGFAGPLQSDIPTWSQP